MARRKRAIELGSSEGTLMICERYSRDGYEPAFRIDHDDDCGEWNDHDAPCSCARVLVLPHQCDKWGIGGPDDVKRMIADLTAATGNWPSAAAKAGKP